MPMMQKHSLEMESVGVTYGSVLEELVAADNYRQLRDVRLDGRYLWVDGVRYVNFSSNDYLGIGSDLALQSEFFGALLSGGLSDRFLMSNPSSRLMTGNSDDYAGLERAIADFYKREACVVLGSGYLLNSGLPGVLCGAGDLIVADKLIHSSLIDGIRLSGAEFERYRHNDMSHLEVILRKRAMRSGGIGRVMVVTESVFSMDGDVADLAGLARLQQEFGFMLYLDEAHAFGVCGAQGRGVSWEVPELRVDILVATMGKALASQGAFVVCSDEVRRLIVNKMRTLIFSTALPPISLLWSRFVVERLSDSVCCGRREKLVEYVGVMGSETHIVPVMCGSNAAALELAERICEAGGWATAIRHPTVARGAARVRVSLTAALEMDDILKIKELCCING